jgi:hypothetical protein
MVAQSAKEALSIFRKFKNEHKPKTRKQITYNPPKAKPRAKPKAKTPKKTQSPQNCGDDTVWVSGFCRKKPRKTPARKKPTPAVLVDQKGDPVGQVVVKSVAIPNSGVGKKGRRIQSLVVASAPSNPLFAPANSVKKTDAQKLEMQKGQDLYDFYSSIQHLSEKDQMKVIRQREKMKAADAKREKWI